MMQEKLPENSVKYIEKLPEKIKVLHIGKYFAPYRGGIETYLLNLCDGLLDNCELKVMVSNIVNETIEEVIENISIVRVAKWDQIFSTPICPKMPILLKKWGSAFDIIHVHLPNPMAIISYLLVKPKAKLVVSYHSDIIKQKHIFRFYKKFLLRFLDCADKIIVATPNHIKFSNILQNFKEKCEVVHYGINIKNFENISRKKVMNIREKYRGPIVLFVGRLVYYKGLEYLIEALKGENINLIIAGTGPFYPNLKLISSGLENVHFIGEISDINLPAYYHACDVFVLPSVSRSEAFGIVQLEAMACRKPIVSTDIKTGVPYVNQHLKTGLIVPKEDTFALKEAILKLIHDKHLREQLGKNARQRVEQEFSIQEMVRKTLDIYCSLL